VGLASVVWAFSDHRNRLEQRAHAVISYGDGRLTPPLPGDGQFKGPLAPFSFPDKPDLTLWVLPVFLGTKQIVLPETDDPRLESYFRCSTRAASERLSGEMLQRCKLTKVLCGLLVRIQFVAKHG